MHGLSRLLMRACLIARLIQNSAPKDQLMLKSYTRLKDKYKNGYEKLKFATSKDLRDEILSDIHAKIEKLERILAASDKVAA